MNHSETTMIASCHCGNVELEVTGKPILAAACHCQDCTVGSRRIETRPNADQF